VDRSRLRVAISSVVTPETARPMRRPLTRHQIWFVLALLLVIGGMASALAGANSVARSDDQKARQSFDRSSADVTDSLRSALQHEADLVINAGGYLVAEPNSSEAQFLGWVGSVQLWQRYPEVEGLGALVIVPAAQLPAFAARVAADPAAGLSGSASFSVIPPGPREFYCFATVGQSRNPVASTPAGTDYCAGVGAAPLLSARDSGQGSYVPFVVGKQTRLAIQTPIYNGGSVPATLAQRRATFAGWVGTQVDPSVLLIQALSGFPKMWVSMSYHSSAGGAAVAVFASAPSAAGPTSTTTDFGNGWTVTTAGVVPARDIFTDDSAWRVLLGGFAVSLLAGALMFVLATGRERARRLVEQRTGELRHQSLHDALTGLPNRSLVIDRVDQLLARGRRHGTVAAALFIDIDDFKNVNDTLGHQIGDGLLIAVADRLASTLRDADTIARMGGDEFVVLVDGTFLGEGPELVADRLLDVMREPFDVAGAPSPLIVSISIGIATGDRSSGGELLRDADVALYQAKAAGKDRYEVFRADIQTTISRRLDLGFDLRSALSGNQYRLVYQPIYNLNDLSLVGVEALLRWDHPLEGLIQPDEFIPILEQTGQISDVGRWVLQAACAQMAKWHERGDTLDVSVNVSGRQLDNDSLVDDVRAALSSSGLPAESLIIEVTETALMRNVEATATRLQALKILGVRIAVDDFGTGFSSLAYLRQFPVDCLKIDRMFTNAITSSPESKALVSTLVQLGKDLGLSVLAEGVETTEEMDLLRNARVDQAQGFLLARPLDATAFEVQLLSPTRRSGKGLGSLTVPAGSDATS